MKFLEKNLEDIIFEQLKNHNGYSILGDRGLNLEYNPFYCAKPTLLKRQLRIGNYGVCDIVSMNRETYLSIAQASEKHTITIFELKQKQINLSTLIQASRYAKGIKIYLENIRRFEDYKFRIVLIGETVDFHSNWVYLFDIIPEISEIVSIYTYKYDFDGITFKEYCLADYQLINNGFNLNR